MWVNKLIRLGFSPANHKTVERKSGDVIGVRGVGGDHGGVKVDIGGMLVIEDESGVIEVIEINCAEADEFEGE